MSLYDDKGLEEVQEIVSLFKQTYRDRYGEDPDPSLLKLKLHEIIDEKKERHFRSVFESMSINNIYMAMNAFDATAVRNTGQSKVDDNHSQLQDKVTKKVTKSKKGNLNAPKEV